MSFHVSLVGRRDLSGEIYRQLRRAILEGRLRPGDRLPSSRELARTLTMSTITAAVGSRGLHDYLVRQPFGGHVDQAHAPFLLRRLHLAGLERTVDTGLIGDRLVGRQEDVLDPALARRATRRRALRYATSPRCPASGPRMFWRR